MKPLHALVLLLLFAPSAAWSGLAEVKSAVNAEVRRAKSVAPNLGVHIIAVESGDPIYSYNADTPRIIASNTKLFTTAAALDTLGPGHFFETPVLVRGAVRDGVLEGDLAVVGGGDPNLSGRLYYGDSFGAFRDWADTLKRSGVRRIQGEIVLATGFFDDEIIHPDWPRDQLDRWYEAPVSALSFNDNSILVEVEPGRRGPDVRIRPSLEIFALESSLTPARSAKQHVVRISRDALAETRRERSTIEVGGRVWRGAGIVDQWVAVPDPVQYFAAALHQALREEGIEVDGRVVRVENLVSRDWRPLLTHRTDLLTTIDVINKRSQNFYAESLFKLLGAELCGDGSWEGGKRAVGDFLERIDLPGEPRLADGSGMSRNNQFAPVQLTHLLRTMHFHRHGQEFLRSLPYSGEADLSWRRRLAEPPYRGNVFAKTGTLSGVSTLSGYAKGRSGTLYAFSILLNNASATWRAKSAQDRILRALIDKG